MSEFPMVTFMAHGEEHTIPAATLAKIGEYARKKAASAANDAGDDTSASACQRCGKPGDFRMGDFHHIWAQDEWDCVASDGPSTPGPEKRTLGEPLFPHEVADDVGVVTCLCGHEPRVHLNGIGFCGDCGYSKCQGFRVWEEVDGPEDAAPLNPPDVTQTILKAVEQRRSDPEFMARLEASIARNRPILDALEAHDGPRDDVTDEPCTCDAPTMKLLANHLQFCPVAVAERTKKRLASPSASDAPNLLMEATELLRIYGRGEQPHPKRMEAFFQFANALYPADGYDDGSTRSTKRPDGTWEVAPSTSQGAEG